jgi:tetratricopeptide (TPR) repeat protein
MPFSRPAASVLVSLTALALGACGGVRHKDSIGSLNDKDVEIEEPMIKDSLDKAMQAYRKFLTETDEETAATPEAMRRLADLQLEAGAGTYDFVDKAQQGGESGEDRAAAAGVEQESIDPAQFGRSRVDSPVMAPGPGDSDEGPRESEDAFEERATQIADLAPSETDTEALSEDMAEQQAIAQANTEEAIELYQQLLEKYPLYERNDQVMYQLARAYEEGGRLQDAKDVLDKLVVKYPDSIHYDEAQFRRGEIFFVREQYRDAESAYSEVVDIGPTSAFFDQALFKRGWTLFKQSLYHDALDDYIRLLDMKTAAGYHIRTESNKTEYQRVQDTFRVVSLSFSYLGGPEYIEEYFNTRGARDYEYLVYQHLGEHYLTKRRYQDAADVYKAFLDLYPLHEQAPAYHMRIVEIYRKGQFPQLVIEAKRDFAITYDINGEYWSYHDVNEQPEVLAFIKTNLNDLAKHYHALSQQAKKRDERREAYQEAARWYRAFLGSFPEDEKAPELNFLLAELLFDNKAFGEAAEEYERTAYAYPVHSKAAESGYAAILAYREHEKQVPAHRRNEVHLETIRSSLQFAETYPSHPEAAAVLTAAAESLYQLDEFERAIAAAESVLQNHPEAKRKLKTASWIVVAHSTFDLKRFTEAEPAYQEVLKLLPKNDERAKPITDKLAASVYKQAEEHQLAGEPDAAVTDYLRIAEVAPRSDIRETAEFDAATVLIGMEAWGRAADVLEGFRRHFPGSNHLFDVTTKLAYVYEESGQTLDAAREYERIADEGDDPGLQREALNKAADLYVVAEAFPAAIKLYRRFIREYPDPLEPAMEARNQLVDLYERTGNRSARTSVLEDIVEADRRAGDQRSDRTRYLAANAALQLAEPARKTFSDARLGEPFQKTLANKKRLMQKVLDLYGKIADYGVAETTAAATYRIAGVYYEFSRDLLESERPDDLSEEELMQYELLLEEQAYPFEEKAINVHEKNLELLTMGVYNNWIMKSLDQLAKLVPVRYAKPEKGESFFAHIY